MADFQFLYPFWLLLIPVWLLWLYLFYRLKYQSVNWDALVDRSLQPFVVSTKQEMPDVGRISVIKHKGLPLLIGLLAIFALSGPSFYKKSVPLYESEQGLVIALDLSSSMLAQDIKPSRIQAAKFALTDLLKQRRTGYSALVVFAADAFAVSPLTNDEETIFAQLTHMSPIIMPAQGSRLDRAINQAVDLLDQASYQQGQILLITDGMSDQDASVAAAKLALKKGYEVSILAVGSTEGSTIPLGDGRWLRDKYGDEVVAQLNVSALEDVADAGNGLMLSSSSMNSALVDKNIQTLLSRYEADSQDIEAVGNRIEHSVNAGVWLLFPLLILVLLLFRLKGFWRAKSLSLLTGVMFFLVMFSQSNDAYAFEWTDLWLNQQQQAKKILENSKTVDANEIADSRLDLKLKGTQWQAIVAYRSAKYALAAQLFSENDTADGWYNYANALVKMQALDKAIQAYEVALQKQPAHRDAHYNLQMVRKKQQEMADFSAEENSVLALGESQQESNQSAQSPSKTEQQDQQSATLQEEQAAYDKQWLKSIPDDPSGLWRRKFHYQYKKRNQQQETQPW